MFPRLTPRAARGVLVERGVMPIAQKKVPDPPQRDHGTLERNKYSPKRVMLARRLGSP